MEPRRRNARRQVSLTVIDASDESASLEDEVLDLVEDGGVAAMVGMHTSSVRERITRVVGGRLPLVYTPFMRAGSCRPADGDRRNAGRFTAAGACVAQHALCLTRWYLLGNDYCWPRRTHALASER